jgi:hypothetical protein
MLRSRLAKRSATAPCTEGMQCQADDGDASPRIAEADRARAVPFFFPVVQRTGHDRAQGRRPPPRQAPASLARFQEVGTYVLPALRRSMDRIF